ncbi:hypothetical protein GCM10007388_27430 [Pseudoduganella plicata]|uniref:Uncharacterized protein n=1 Tax=Pseudoduganella plicata TaxID=321984 RepID=A0AA87Y7Y5_9BURK|nr:hypothetical protein GCM10007388_27430 [Pseudoduganella plicata]
MARRPAGAFLRNDFAQSCEMEADMYLLLAIPVIYLLLHFSVADVLRAIPDRNEDFGF